MQEIYAAYVSDNFFASAFYGHFRDGKETPFVPLKFFGYLTCADLVFKKIAEDYLHINCDELQFSDDNFKESIQCVIEELKLLASNIKSSVNIYPKLHCDAKANDIIQKFASRFNMRIQAWFVKLNYWISKMSQEEKEMYNLSQS